MLENLRRLIVCETPTLVFGDISLVTFVILFVIQACS